MVAELVDASDGGDGPRAEHLGDDIGRGGLHARVTSWGPGCLLSGPGIVGPPLSSSACVCRAPLLCGVLKVLGGTGLPFLGCSCLSPGVRVTGAPGCMARGVWAGAPTLGMWVVLGRRDTRYFFYIWHPLGAYFHSCVGCSVSR